MTHFEELLHLRVVGGHDDGANARCEARCGGAGTGEGGGVDDAWITTIPTRKQSIQ